jgi:hypothetical protein
MNILTIREKIADIRGQKVDWMCGESAQEIKIETQL